MVIATGWLVGGIGIALLVAGLAEPEAGPTSERRAMAKLEGLATWTESLRDTIAGAVGLEQAIPASLRVAAPSLRDLGCGWWAVCTPGCRCLTHCELFADDLDDPGADLIIAALIINSRLRGPGLRDLLGALSASVREELDMRRKVNAERSWNPAKCQIVVGVSVGLALLLGAVQPRLRTGLQQRCWPVGAGRYRRALRGRDSSGLRRLARFDAPERLLGGSSGRPRAMRTYSGPRGRPGAEVRV